MRILIIEDDKKLCDTIQFDLQQEGYQVDGCYSGEDALYYAKKISYDIILLDRMLPVMDGLSILHKIRSLGIATPVIMVTAMDGIDDRIDGLDAGADDYLVKPFAMEELSARIRALIRRSKKIKDKNILIFGTTVLDVAKLQLQCGDNLCSLSKREGELMEYFMSNQKQVILRENIFFHVWGPDHIVEEGNIDNYIYFLRRRLKSIESSLQIKTIPKVGYCLEENPCSIN